MTGPVYALNASERYRLRACFSISLRSCAFAVAKVFSTAYSGMLAMALAGYALLFLVILALRRASQTSA
jgi:hypothetical protein